MQELLAEGDFVRALARQLLGAADGDDLAQDAWLVALRRAPAAVREPRSWLARVVHRLAANQRRGASRRVKREQRAAALRADAAPSTAEILACEQVRQRVVAAVLALEEPFRGTVLARFYECLDSEAIAARDGVELATVRSRLKRGLDRLRAQLDGEHRGDRAAWAAPLLLLGRDPNAAALPTGVLMGTSKKGFAAAAVLLLAGFVAWSTWLDARGDASPVAPSGSALVAAADGAAADAPRDPAGERTAAAASEAAWGEPRERLPYPVCDEPIDDVAVRVLDVATRRPVAGAEVLFQPFRVDMLAEPARGDQALHEMASSIAFLERYGSRVRTDAVGEAVVRLARTGGRVIASHADRRCDQHVQPTKLLPGERATLWLAPSRWLRVRMVDETSGAPLAGVLLYVSSQQADVLVPQSCGYGGMQGPSDAEGIVRFAWNPEHDSLRVRQWGAVRAVSVALDPPAAFEHITEVRCAATGSMTVELRTPAGHLWPTRIRATARQENGPSSDTAGPVGWCNAEPGIYRIPHLALGASWQVGAYDDENSSTGARAVVVGPTRAGEDVRVVLRTQSEPCVAFATLRLADGSLPPPNLWARAQHARGSSSWGPVREDGHFAWLMGPTGVSEGRIELFDWSRSQSTQLQAAWRCATPAPGQHDLGVIAVEPPPLVVAGELDVGAAAWVGSPLRVRCEHEAADGTWEHLEQLPVDPARDRTFALRRATSAKRVRVAVLADAHLLPPEPRVVPVGTSGLRFVVARGVPLRARVLAPAEYAQAITCRAVREDGGELPGVDPIAHYDAAPPRCEAKLVDFDGEVAHFAWPALPAGSYRIEVRAPGIAAPLRVVDGVRVEPGARPDARLDAIDVRGRTRTLTVSVRPLPAAPLDVTGGGVLAWPSGAQPKVVHGLFFDERGDARLLVGADPVDVLVAVPGHRLWRASAVTESSLQVELAPCFAVNVRLAPGVAERLAGHRVLFRLLPRAAQDEVEDPPQLCFRRAGDSEPAVQTSFSWLQRLAGGGEVRLDDARATAAIPLSGPGRFEVELMVQAGSSWLPVNASWNHWQSSPLVPSEVQVRGVDDAPVVIDVEPKVLAKVCEELSRRR